MMLAVCMIGYGKKLDAKVQSMTLTVCNEGKYDQSYELVVVTNMSRMVKYFAEVESMTLTVIDLRIMYAFTWRGVNGFCKKG